MKTDMYVTYIGAKGVAFAWIGALVGPLFLLVGVLERDVVLCAVGVGALTLIGASFHDGYQAKKSRANSDYIVFTIVPSVLLVVGCTLAALTYIGAI